jgi:predicted aspartyl protease
MFRVVGYLDESGAPAIKSHSLDPVHDSQEFEATIDTGFSGFGSMPLLKPFPLGLLLNGTTKVTFGDSSTAAKLTALGKATIEGAWKVGVVLLEEGSTDVLIGMDFLKRFGLSLLVHPSTALIALVEEGG